MIIGFIGVGIMGRPMAGHLVSAGYELRLKGNRSPLPEELLEAGARPCATAREVAEQSDAIILMLPDTPDVEAVLFDTDGVAEGLNAGKLVIDMSSIDPIATRSFAARVEDLGCDYVDAPVSGGDVGAKAATLTIMAGGTQTAFARALPLLERMGASITHVGSAGSGQTTKVANQIIVALNIEAVAEALVFAAKAGADPAKVHSALMGGFASSRVLEVHGQRMLDRNFAPGFRLKLHQKDLNLALGSARALGLALPNTAIAQQMMSAAANLGGPDADHSALALAIENLAAMPIARAADAPEQG
ncbi:2-hydroxy-3-oxopropionate reductase [Croceicoccus estronivorus]|uniref:2-hydroxy-3-oxopropionate reductase n=1 Tax=Croceicoccus estronivorus TaxID=1172626 RepID=UPI000832600E|nr:2-hydroxy-3-oxopropionate reductase [Croceicoccus estronivorus]OCC24443.1 2-hydroxy-3-oxopropionate reductase [Croceicoccus estronivorus]